MAVDIGAEAINRPSSYGTDVYTVINKDHPATVAGTITSIDVWAQANLTVFRVGTFYTTNGDTLKCRASETIPGTITAGSKVTKVVSIPVEIGDYIGCKSTTGSVDCHLSGYAGIWRASGEYIDPEDETGYLFLAGYAISLGGYITEPPPGWTGKISGVTNPAKIMGVAVANIKSVKGVE